MSKIGKKPVAIVAGVKVEVKGGMCCLESSKGKREVRVPSGIECSIENNHVKLDLKGTSKEDKAMWGTVRALIANEMTGLTAGWSKTLDIKGIGYKAKLQGNALNLALGFTPFDYQIPKGVTVECPTATQIIVKGVDKALVGEVAAVIRAFKKPDAYKGYGIRYNTEIVRTKAVAKKK